MSQHRKGRSDISTVLFLGMTLTAAAEPPRVVPPPGGPESETGSLEPTMFNIPAPTLGGRQFWGDVRFFHGWRIQQNVLTQHFRLLDPQDFRLAWGSREDCEVALEKIRREAQLPPMRGEAVILVHGIVRSSKSFSSMVTQLEDAGYTVVGFDYPSTQVTMAQSAEYLHEVIQSLQGIEKIHFVCHSMGGLIVRSYLQHHPPDPRLSRMVMLGVPNLGAKMANLMRENLLFQFIYGPAGQQLVEDPMGYIAQLPVPAFEFAVIAGGKGTPEGWNPLIPGDDDGTVSVESTRLSGARDFLEIPAMHSFMMGNADVQLATIRFLKTGALRDTGQREPIPAPSSDIEEN